MGLIRDIKTGWRVLLLTKTSHVSHLRKSTVNLRSYTGKPFASVNRLMKLRGGKEHTALRQAWKELCVSSWKVNLNQIRCWTHYNVAPFCSIRRTGLNPTEMLRTQGVQHHIDLFFLSSTRAITFNHAHHTRRKTCFYVFVFLSD